MPIPRAIRLAVVAALCACDHGPIDSGLPEGKHANELTPVETKQLCEAAGTYYERVVSDADLLRYICTSRALAESGGELAACQEHLQMCVADPPPPVEAIAADVRADGICDPLVLAGCAATVGQVEECLAEFVEYIDALYASHSCEKLGMMPDPKDEVAVGPACEAIAEVCPGIAS